MELTGKIIVVTGAKGGLGTSVTSSLLGAGAHVVGVSRSIAASDFPHENFSAMPVSLANGDDAKALATVVVERWRRIDGLVHLVGGFAGGKTVADTDDATLDRMFELNFRSAFYVIQAVLPHMRTQGSGSIVAIGSKAAVEPSPMAGVYAASKAALVSLLRTVARENSDRSITANMVLPGTMDTPANRAAAPAADFSKWVRPCQVATLVEYLLSARANQLSGAMIPVYGGEV